MSRTKIVAKSHAKQARDGYRRYCVRLNPEAVECLQELARPGESPGQTIARVLIGEVLRK